MIVYIMAANESQQQHRSTLKRYLQAHSATWQADNPTHRSTNSTKSLKPTSKSQLSYQTVQSTQAYKPNSKSCSLKLPHIPSRGKEKATIASLPDEILSLIFWKLKVGDLIRASQVCHRWHKVSGDNLLWKKLYARFVGTTTKEKEDKVPVSELNPGCWRNICLRRCKVKRDQMYLKKWKHPDPYTGLKQRPELTLSKMGVRFELSFINSEGLSHTMPHSDIYWSTMSVSMRWYELVLPNVKDIHCIRIHACCPLMFYGPSKPAKDGFIQKSLLMIYNCDSRDVVHKKNALGSDAQIQLYELTKGLNLAKYKADGEIAFVTCTLHYHNLISRCLYGAPDRLWSPPSHPCTEDDIDPEYGLHGYTCVILIRNMRQKLLECKFTNLHTHKESVVDGYATFNPVKKNDKMSHVPCLREISFPWRTTLFKGIVQDVGILDITLLDENGSPFWVVSSGVSVEKCTQTNQFDFDPNTYLTIHYHDDKGKLHLEIGTLDDGSQYLSCASISLSVAAINETFRRCY